LRELLGQLPGTVAYGCAPEPDEVQGAAIIIDPHCVVIDPPCHKPIGRALMRRVKKTRPKCAIVVVSNHLTDESMRCYADAGAEYFFNKSQQFEDVVRLVGRLGEDR
jgi:DNA-binding NarL/FixJ family response regulator